MRDANEMKNIILNYAKHEDRIRAVLLSGSRANPNITPDPYQDFDLVFFVTNLDSFIQDHSWTDIFGEKCIWQMPDTMSFGKEDIIQNNPTHFSYLMLFQDGNRIDLTLLSLSTLSTEHVQDSLTIVWLDKDYMFKNLPPPHDSDYHVCKPSQSEFLDTCNEFWWVSTYVAKGLVRKEITYAKEKMETIVRPMFMKMLSWKIGSEQNFAVNFGVGGKWMQKYLSVEEYKSVLNTYSDSVITNNWKALFAMIEIFSKNAKLVASYLSFNYNLGEERNVIQYLHKLYSKSFEE